MAFNLEAEGEDAVEPHDSGLETFFFFFSRCLQVDNGGTSYLLHQNQRAL